MLPDTDQKLVGVYDLILVSWPYWFVTEARPLKAIRNESLLKKTNFEASCITFDWPGRPPARISSPPPPPISSKSPPSMSHPSPMPGSWFNLSDLSRTYCSCYTISLYSSVAFALPISFQLSYVRKDNVTFVKKAEMYGASCLRSRMFLLINIWTSVSGLPRNPHVLQVWSSNISKAIFSGERSFV